MTSTSNVDFRRQSERELALDRGRILAEDGTIIAETRFDEEGKAQRIYHEPSLAAVTGYWTLFLGKSGLEASFDDFLSGRRGQQGLEVFDDLMHEDSCWS